MQKLTNTELLQIHEQLQKHLVKAIKNPPYDKRRGVFEIALLIVSLCKEAHKRGLDINIDLNQVLN